MSLVIGAIRENQITIISDTKMTPGITSDCREGLKIFFLDAHTCLAFAGGEFAFDLIFECFRKQQEGGSVQDILILLCAAQKKLNKDKHISKETIPDFILACTKGVSVLYQVKDLTDPVEIRDFTFIGNADAATDFREYFSKLRQNPMYQSLPDQGLLGIAFSELLKTNVHSSVGGLAVVAIGKPEGFTFQESIALTPPQFLRQVPKEGWNAVDFGTAATGGYAFTTIVPCELGVTGYGVYYFQGKYGIFFRADLANRKLDRFRSKANSVVHFVDVISREVQFPVKHCGELGGQ